MQSTDDLILSHYDKVRGCAWYARRRMSFDIEVDELISAGYVGLVQAAHTFDPSKHIQFWTWGYRRVMGAMIDYARTIRGRKSQRKKGKRRSGGGIRLAWIPLEDVEEPSTRMLIDEAIERREQRALVRKAVQQLEGKQRLVIERTLEGRSMREIGHELNVTHATPEYYKRRAIANIKRTLNMEETP